MEKENLEDDLQKLREKVMAAEKERLNGVKSMGISEARENLRERVLKKD